MKALIIIIVQLAVSCNLAYGVLRPAARTTAERIRSFGYGSETHNIITKDGYGLTVFRIKNSPKAVSYSRANHLRPVVLLMHGLVGSSDCWVINGPKDALAFNLVDSGYDVWIGNSRGNPYSNRHVSLSTSSRQFWRFSWHEIGIIDLPTTIDYILKQTRQTSLHYVGHSQGTSIMFVLLSTRPEYNRKLKTSHMLAPTAYMKYASSAVVRYFTPFVGTYNELDPIFGDKAFFQHPLLQQVLGLNKCRQNSLAYRPLCSFWLAFAGGVTGYISDTLWPEIFNTHPASCSTHQAFHFVQLHVSERFRQYDFGVHGNLQRYNRTSPPDYAVSNINPRFPLYLYYSDYDVWSAKIDVEYFSRILGNRSVNVFIPLKQFSHYDFLWATNVRDTINRGILNRMSKAENILQRRSINYV